MAKKDKPVDTFGYTVSGQQIKRNGIPLTQKELQHIVDGYLIPEAKRDIRRVKADAKWKEYLIELANKRS